MNKLDRMRNFLSFSLLVSSLLLGTALDTPGGGEVASK